jgi:hypothetical protein
LNFKYEIQNTRQDAEYIVLTRQSQARAILQATAGVEILDYFLSVFTIKEKPIRLTKTTKKEYIKFRFTITE